MWKKSKRILLCILALMFQYPGGYDFRHGCERGRRVLYERGGLYVQGPGKAQAGLLCREAVQEI